MCVCLPPKQTPCLCLAFCVRVTLFSSGAQDPSPPWVSHKPTCLTQPIQSLTPVDAHDFTDRHAAGLLYLLGGWIDRSCLLSQGENNLGRPTEVCSYLGEGVQGTQAALWKKWNERSYRQWHKPSCFAVLDNINVQQILMKNRFSQKAFVSSLHTNCLCQLHLILE